MSLPTSFDQYTPQIISRVQQDPALTASTGFWRGFFLSQTVLSEQADIRFDEIQASRRVAPFMRATMPGRPIYRGEGETIRAFRPAYTKPKDEVTPSEHMQMTGPEVSRRIGLLSPAERMAQRVVNIARAHREAIERLWDYMYARSLTDAKLTINFMTDDGLVSKTVEMDYARLPSHTRTSDRSGTSSWTNDSLDILSWINDRVDEVAGARNGGVVTDILMGSDAAKTFRAFFRGDGSRKGKDYLDLNTSGAEAVRVARGIVRTDRLNPFTYLGNLDGNLECWKVSGPGNQFENDDGSFTNIVGSWDVILVSPNVEMIMAFGAIQDVDFLQPATIWPKMWVQNDPSARIIMSQSAPLAIPVNPNATMKATVGGG